MIGCSRATVYRYLSGE
ncbi:hypothetical protein F6W96_39075 [Nocardia terpenica]|uniref:Uncharacterized protein n=1 Tax=Nocardia terpenica TaxID=455432 RepID=A0A6G9ZHA8_9NOCA|nr:hypothetical protein F6W96_39075 [Nocardia terpenica]